MIVGRSLQTSSLMKPGKVLFLSSSTASNGSLTLLAAVFFASCFWSGCNFLEIASAVSPSSPSNFFDCLEQCLFGVEPHICNILFQLFFATFFCSKIRECQVGLAVAMWCNNNLLGFTIKIVMEKHRVPSLYVYSIFNRYSGFIIFGT